MNIEAKILNNVSDNQTRHCIKKEIQIEIYGRNTRMVQHLKSINVILISREKLHDHPS